MVASGLVLVLQAVFVADLGLRAIPEEQELDFDELSDDELRAWADMVRRLLLCGLIPRELRQRARHELRNAYMELSSREDEYERRTLREVHATGVVEGADVIYRELQRSGVRYPDADTIFDMWLERQPRRESD